MAGNTLNARVGPAYQADGNATQDVRQDAHGALIVLQAGGKYKEAVKRGNVYSATSAAAGVALTNALGTTSEFTLYNPVGSGKNFILHKITYSLRAGTSGARVVHLTAGPTTDAVPSGGTAITPKNRLLGAANASVATAGEGMTCTTQAAKMVDILCTTNEAVFATTALNDELIEKDLDGSLIVGPGTAIHVQGTGDAGSGTPKVCISCQWEEEPIAA